MAGDLKAREYGMVSSVIRDLVLHLQFYST